GGITRRQVQPVRAPFFVSAWWHLQAPESWPPFYPSARGPLVSEGLLSEPNDPIENYFAFREVFLELMAGLDLPAWELGHLLSWYHELPSPDASTGRLDPPAAEAIEPDVPDT